MTVLGAIVAVILNLVIPQEDVDPVEVDHPMGLQLEDHIMDIKGNSTNESLSRSGETGFKAPEVAGPMVKEA